MGASFSKINRETRKGINWRSRWDDKIFKRGAHDWSCWALGPQLLTKLHRKYIQIKWKKSENRRLSHGKDGRIAAGTCWRSTINPKLKRRDNKRAWRDYNL